MPGTSRSSTGCRTARRAACAICRPRSRASRSRGNAAHAGHATTRSATPARRPASSRSRCSTPPGRSGPNEHLIVTYQTELDADTQNGATLTNVAGATEWFNGDSSNPDRQPYTRTLTNGTVGTLDHQDAHTVTVALTGYFFEKTVANLTTGASPTATAAAGRHAALHAAPAERRRAAHERRDPRRAGRAQRAGRPSCRARSRWSPARRRRRQQHQQHRRRQRHRRHRHPQPERRDRRRRSRSSSTSRWPRRSRSAPSSRTSRRCGSRTTRRARSRDDPNVNGPADPIVAGDEDPTRVRDRADDARVREDRCQRHERREPGRRGEPG